jgi:hypothetical protein
LALYVSGLLLLAFAVDGETTVVTDPVMGDDQQLLAAEAPAGREAILDHPRD